MKKQVIIGIVLTLLIAGGFVGYNKWAAYQKEQRLVKEVDRKLTEAERKIYEDRLVEVEKRLQNPKDDGEKTELLWFKAVQLQGLGKLAEARQVLLTAIEFNPKEYDLFVSLHLVYLEMTDFEEARTAIIKATVLSPQDPDGWRRYILLEQEKFDSSPEHIKSMFAEALTKTNDHVDMVKLYAGYLEKIGDYSAAISYWEQAIQKFPSSREIYQKEIERLQGKL